MWRQPGILTGVVVDGVLEGIVAFQAQLAVYVPCAFKLNTMAGLIAGILRNIGVTDGHQRNYVVPLVVKKGEAGLQATGGLPGSGQLISNDGFGFEIRVTNVDGVVGVVLLGKRRSPKRTAMQSFENDVMPGIPDQRKAWIGGIAEVRRRRCNSTMGGKTRRRLFGDRVLRARVRAHPIVPR